MEEVRQWLAKAEDEYDTALVNFKAKKYFSSAFWCQQAAEKGLKALLISATRRFPKIHDLVQLAKSGGAPPNILELCSKLNPAYTAARYPDFSKVFSSEESEVLLNASREVLRWIKKKLKF